MVSASTASPTDAAMNYFNPTDMIMVVVVVVVVALEIL
jgi:hypothetical protein